LRALSSRVHSPRPQPNTPPPGAMIPF